MQPLIQNDCQCKFNPSWKCIELKYSLHWIRKLQSLIDVHTGTTHDHCAIFSQSSFHFPICSSVSFLLFRKVDIPGGSSHRNTMLVKHFPHSIFHFRVIRIKVEHITNNTSKALIGKCLGSKTKILCNKTSWHHSTQCLQTEPPTYHNEGPVSRKSRNFSGVFRVP